MLGNCATGTALVIPLHGHREYPVIVLDAAASGLIRGDDVIDPARHVIETWPDAEAPMVFGGYELGAAVITGKVYVDAPPSPMRRCYEIAYDSLHKGRPSWDQLTILQAVRGCTFGGVTYWTEVAGSNLVDADGTNHWQAKPVRRQTYLVQALDSAAMATLIDELMTRLPKAQPKQ